MKNETEHAPEGLDPRPLMLRRLIWDIFPHDLDLIRGVQGMLGLVPDGDEGLDMGHDASDTRLNRVNPLSEALQVLAAYTAEVMGRYLIALCGAHTDDEVEVPDDFHEGFARQNTQVIYDGTFAILAHWLDTGVLAYGPRVRKA